MKKNLCALLLATAATCALAQDPDMQTARAALQAGKPAQALELLRPLEAQQAGNPDFDYLLALALLDSGDPERAVFALERVLAVRPGHAQARAEIGRAYLLLGERKEGIAELEATRRQDIPEEVQQTIANYLDALGAGPMRLSAYLETSIGHDSNANSGVSANAFAIPALGNLQLGLSSSARETSTSFFNLAGGANFMRPLAANWAFLAGASFSDRQNKQYDQFDTRTLDANLGLRYASGRNAFTLGFQHQTFSVDHLRNRTANGLIGQWQYQLNAATQFSLFGQHTQLRYPSQDIRNADRSIIGAALASVFPGAWTPSAYASVYAGKEREKETGVPHFGHPPYGLRFGGQLRPSSTLTLFANFSGENRRYGGNDPLFLVRRSDLQLDLQFGAHYEPRRYWIVTPQVSHTRNDSNVAINDYSRTLFSVTLRREF